MCKRNGKEVIIMNPSEAKKVVKEGKVIKIYPGNQSDQEESYFFLDDGKLRLQTASGNYSYPEFENGPNKKLLENFDVVYYALLKRYANGYGVLTDISVDELKALSS